MNISLARERKIQILSAILLIGFSAAVFWHYAMRSYLGLGHDMGTFLFRPADHFMDFFNLVEHNKNLQPYVNRLSVFGVYFPLGELFFYPFYRLFPGTVGLLMFLGLFLLAWTVILVKHFSQPEKIDNIRDLFIIGFLNYPLLFAVDRANVELYIFLAVCGFFHFYGHRDRRVSLAGLFCLSAAISMKPFPVLFLAMLAAEKKWKDLILALGMCIGTCVLAILCFKGGFFENIQGLRENQAKFFSENMLGSEGWAYGSSLFGGLKIVLHNLTDILHAAGLVATEEYQNIFIRIVRASSRLYSVAALAGIALAARYVSVTRCEQWKKIAILTFLMVILPFASGDYRLLYLFIPLLFFIKTKERSPYDLAYIILFGLLLAPKNYYMIPISSSENLGLGVLLNPLLMLVFIILIVKDNKRKFEVIS